MKIWLLTFESTYTRKVGGLAEVPPRLGTALKNKGHDVTIIVPSHGFIKEHSKELEFIKKYRIRNRTIEIYMYSKPPVEHIIIGGDILEESEVYASEYLLEKIILWSIGLKLYAEYLLNNEGIIPDIVHANDWHSVPGIVGLKSVYDMKGSRDYVGFYYQIHLLSRYYYPIEHLTYMIGVDPNKEVRGIYGWKTFREYYELSHGYADRLGGLLSDKTLTVSREYIKEVVKRIGWDLIEHVDYIPNATTWKTEEIINNVLKIHETLKTYIRELNDIISNRINIRKYFLLEGLSKMSSDEPVIDDKDFKAFIDKLDVPPFMGGGKIVPFKEEGPLAIITGRLARQKGIHVFLKAVEEIIYRVPEAKFVLLLLPVWGEKRLAEELIEYTITMPDNIRVVFGRAKSIYQLAHLAADIMIAPSIYEPFGLMALEAMSAGAPVVASKTGGLAETVIDIIMNGVTGTGLHVIPGDPDDLADKTSDLLLFMETSNYEAWSREWKRVLERINNKALVEILLSNPKAPELVRRSSIRRAMSYTWDKSAEKALKIYMGAKNDLQKI